MNSLHLDIFTFVLTALGTLNVTQLSPLFPLLLNLFGKQNKHSLKRKEKDMDFWIRTNLKWKMTILDNIGRKKGTQCTQTNIFFSFHFLDIEMQTLITTNITDTDRTPKVKHINMPFRNSWCFLTMYTEKMAYFVLFFVKIIKNLSWFGLTSCKETYHSGESGLTTS